MMSPVELASLVNGLSIGIAKGKSIDELYTLAAVFTQIGDTLSTMAMQMTNIQTCTQKAVTQNTINTQRGSN